MKLLHHLSAEELSALRRAAEGRIITLYGTISRAKRHLRETLEADLAHAKSLSAKIEQAVGKAP